MPLRVIEYRQLVHILTLFLIVQFSGLLLAVQIFNGATFEQIQSAEISSAPITVLFFVGYIIIFTALLLFILKIYKGEKLFLVIEAVVVFLSSFIVFSLVSAIPFHAVADTLNGNGPPAIYLVALFSSLALVVAKNRIPRLRNLAAIVSSIGAGLLLGVSFSFSISFLLMVVLAVYDFVAVFITKHMIALGDMAVSKNLAFLIMASEVKAVPLSSLSERERKEYQKEKRALEKQGGIISEIVKSNMVPLAARTALGTGDLAIPLMLAVSAYQVQFNFELSFVIVLGAVFGLILTMLILRKYRRALPAIPPLLFGITVAILIYFAISNIL